MADNNGKSGYRTINLEQGMPTCDQAIRRLTADLYASRSLKYEAIKLIHGYGSSGVGGRLRTETRRYLGNCMKKGLIKSYIEGEHFEIFDRDTQQALMKYRFLSSDSDLGRHNNGITIVLL